MGRAFARALQREFAGMTLKHDITFRQDCLLMPPCDISIIMPFPAVLLFYLNCCLSCFTTD